MKALAREDFREARIRFQEAVEIFPESGRAHYGLGVALLEFDELSQARRHLREATKLEPSLIEAFYQLGVIALREDKLDEAEQALRKALETQPDHAAAQSAFSQVLERGGKLKDAETALRRSLVLDPFQPTSFLRLARMYVRVHAEGPAIQVLEEGVRLNPREKVQSEADLSLLYNELGILLAHGGKYAEAIDALGRALSLPGATPEIAFNLGWAHAAKGESQTALGYFQQYLNLADASAPGVRVATNVVAHLRQRIERQSE